MTLVGTNNRLSAIGASTIAATGVSGINEGDGFMHYVWSGVSPRLTYHPVEAAGSETLAQTLDRVPNYDDRDIHPVMPGHAVVCAGRSSINDGTAGAGVISMLTTYESILDGLLTRGCLPVVVAIPPADTAKQAETSRYNTGLALMAQKKGLAYIDPSALVIVEADGTLDDTLSIDTQHFNPAGSKLYGDYVATKLLLGGPTYWDTPLINANDTVTDDAYKLSNGLLLTDAGSNGSPDNWVIGSNPNTELSLALADASPDGVAGNWMKVTKSASTADGAVNCTISSVVAGNWMAVGWADKWDYASGSNSSIRTEIMTAGSANLYRKHILADSDLGVSRTWQVFKVPAATTALTFRILMNAVGTYYFGQPTVIDLTAQGLDAWI